MTRLAVLAFVPLLFGCASRARGPVVPPASCETGEATYYASSLAGHATASGERYDPSAMTAAHKTYRMGTRVRVVWRDREVIVRINDRGPFTRGTIIDLSRSAADELGMTRAGRVPVRVCPLLPLHFTSARRGPAPNAATWPLSSAT